MMQLGEQIVKELELERSDDILGRWLAHHVAELMQAARAAQRSGTSQEATDASQQCRTAILQLWRHRSDWPHGWPPPRAVEITKRFNELDEEHFPYGKTSLINALQDAHERLLAAIIDCVVVRADGSTEERWLDLFGELLSEDEIEILERAVATEPRLEYLAERVPERAADEADASAGHPLLELADEYRGIIADVINRSHKDDQPGTD